MLVDVSICVFAIQPSTSLGFKKKRKEKRVTSNFVWFLTFGIIFYWHPQFLLADASVMQRWKCEQQMSFKTRDLIYLQTRVLIFPVNVLFLFVFVDCYETIARSVCK